MSVIETYREKVGAFEAARREVEKLRKEAIEELLQQRKEINAQLRQLGYEGEEPAKRSRERPQSNGIHAENGATSAPDVIELENGRKRRRAKGARTFNEADCALCGIKGHDLRAHRGQSRKRAFSAAELRERGYKAAD
jgi:hypothetical protein